MNTIERHRDERQQDDWAERLGKRLSSIFIALLALMFFYGYFGTLI